MVKFGIALDESFKMNSTSGVRKIPVGIMI